jgi:S-adenosylmethionine uptake transporter
MGITPRFSSALYLQGAAWFVFVSLTSAFNDTFVKLSGSSLSGIEVTFYRFFFSVLTLLPFMFMKGRKAFVTPHWKVHGVRSLFLFAAIVPWSYGVIALPLPLVTTLSFTTPFFVLLLSSFFLKEKIGLHRALATILGFAGIIVSAQPTLAGMNWTVFVLVLSTILFASLDVVNKKLLIQNETLLSLLFFSAFGTTLLSAPFALWNLSLPSLKDLFFLLCLGGGANLILFGLLKAFQHCELSSLQPLRYVELLFSSLLSYFIFSELPDVFTLFGAALIVPATLYITYFETKGRKKEAETQACASV